MKNKFMHFFARLLSLALILTMTPLSAFAGTAGELSNENARNTGSEDLTPMQAEVPVEATLKANGIDEKKSSTDIAQELNFSGAEPFTKDVAWDPLQVGERVEKVGLFKDCMKITPVQMYMQNGILLEGGTKPSIAGKEYNRESHMSQAANILSSPRSFVDVTADRSGTDLINRYSGMPDGEMPGAMTAGDIDGDGAEEILWYHIVIKDNNGNLVTGKAKAVLEKFNKGAKATKDQLTATYQLDIIRPVIKEGEDSPGAYTIQTYNPPNYTNSFNNRPLNKGDTYRIPVNMLEWSSFISVKALDVDGDGCDEVAASAINNGAIALYNITGSSNGLSLGCTGVAASHFVSVTASTQAAYINLDAGDLNGDGIEDLVFACSTDADDTGTTSLYGVFYQSSPSQFRVIDELAKGIVADSKRLSMVNCGVTVGDIDHDGVNELILGGAAKGDSSVKYALPDSSGAASAPYRVETEMTLLAMRLNEKNLGSYKSNFEQVAVTVLRDDEDMYANVKGGDTRYKVNQNATNRMHNLSSWFVPVKAVSFTGMKSGNNWDQIYFGNHIYYLDSTGTFRIYDDSRSAKNAPKLYDEFDADRVSVIAVEASPAFIDPGLDAFSGKEQLIIYYMKDAPTYDYGFGFTTLYEEPDSAADMNIQKTAACLGEYANYKSCDLYPMVAFFEPGGKDLSYAYNLTGRERVLSEPEALALLSAPPTFKDYIASQTQNGMSTYDPGSTNIEESKGTSSSTGNEGSFSVGPVTSFDFLGIMSLDASFMYEHGEGENDEFTKSSSFSAGTTDSAEDIVELTTVPIDVYYYNAYVPNLFKRYMTGSVTYAGNPDYPSTDPNWTPLQTAIPAEAQKKATTITVYNEYAKKYGKHVFEYGRGKDLPYTVGDPFSYPSAITEYGNLKEVYIHDQQIVTSTNSGDTTVSFGSDKAHTKEWSNGFDAEISFSIFGVGLGAEGGYMNTNSKTDFSGHTFSARFTSLPPEYSISSKVFISKKTITETDPRTGQKVTRDIPFMGYLKDNATAKPKLPDNIVQSNLDNLSPTAIAISYEVPADLSQGLKADHYELYRYDAYRKCWITISRNLPYTPGQTSTYIDEQKLAPNMVYKYKMIATKLSGTAGATPSGDTSTYNEITLMQYKTKIIADPPVITKQPANVTVVAGEDAVFSIEAEPPSGKEGAELKYDWYYSPKGESKYNKVSALNSIAGNLPESKEEIGEDKTLILHAVPSDLDGYRFACQVGREEMLQTVTVNSSYATLTVLKEAPKLFKIEYSAASKSLLGSVSCTGTDGAAIKSGDTALQNSKITFTASPIAGYKVKSWMVNGKEAIDASGNILNDSTFIMEHLQGDANVIVSFEKKMCEVKFAAEGNGSVTAQASGVPLEAGEKIFSGTDVSINAKPDEGYMLSHYLRYDPNSGEWKTVKDKDGYPLIQEKYTFPLTSDINVKAVFTEISTLSLSYTELEDIPSMKDSVLSISLNGEKPAELRNGQSLTGIKPGSKVKIQIEPGLGAQMYAYVAAPEKGEPVRAQTKSTTFEIPALNSNYDLYAYFVSVGRTVSFDAQGDGRVAASVNGSPIENGAEIRSGSIVEFQAIPGQNQMFTGWTVNGAADVSDSNDKMSMKVEKNTAVSAGFAPLITETEMSEAELKQLLIDKFGEDAVSHWSKDSIKQLISKGVFENFPDGEISPDDIAKRGWLAQVIKNMAGADDTVIGGDDGTYKDLNPEDFFTEAVKWCTKNGYMNGMTDETFKPEEGITREQLAVTLVNFIDKQGIHIPENATIEYKDEEQIADGAKDAVDRAASMGVLNGDKDGTFNPKEPATVAELSQAVEQVILNTVPETIPETIPEDPPVFAAPDENTVFAEPQKKPEAMEPEKKPEAMEPEKKPEAIAPEKDKPIEKPKETVPDDKSSTTLDDNPPIEEEEAADSDL